MNDIEIASLCTKKDILTIAKELGLDEDSVIQYGKYKAKIKANDIMKGKNGKLILVTAINPTKILLHMVRVRQQYLLVLLML